MKRSGVRRVVFGLAVACFVGAMAMLGTTGWALANLGLAHVATASLFATSLFLGGCGVVLYFMSLPARPVGRQ